MISSDGRLVLLRAAERRLGLDDTLASCIREWCDPARARSLFPCVRAGDDGDASGGPPVDVAVEEQAWDEAMHRALNTTRAEVFRQSLKALAKRAFRNA